MRDREKRKRSERDSLDARVGIERGIEDQMTAFMNDQAQCPTGKELHSVERAMLIRRRRL